jgi:hypothetical protein
VKLRIEAKPIGDKEIVPYLDGQSVMEKTLWGIPLRIVVDPGLIATVMSMAGRVSEKGALLVRVEVDD